MPGAIGLARARLAARLAGMRRFQLAFAAPILATLCAPAAAQSADPMRFFAGRTESDGIVKVLFHKPYRTHSTSVGWIEPDGSLVLVQKVEDDGKPPLERRWRVRETGPAHWTATMTQAVGPVAIDRVGGRYRFRFTMAGHLNVEQWLTPLPGATAARTLIKVRKFGLTVATTEGVVRKLPGD
jgi:hypothetical protein